MNSEAAMKPLLDEKLKKDHREIAAKHKKLKEEEN